MLSVNTIVIVLIHYVMNIKVTVIIVMTCYLHVNLSSLDLEASQYYVLHIIIIMVFLYPDCSPVTL